jgi:hypothetical protein
LVVVVSSLLGDLCVGAGEEEEEREDARGIMENLSRLSSSHSRYFPF